MEQVTRGPGSEQSNEKDLERVCTAVDYAPGC